MDIHRIRFVPQPAHEINALAFSHRSNANEPTPSQLRLALGRSNGDIEIWNPQSRASSSNTANNTPSKTSTAGTTSSGSGATWCQEAILRGGKDRTIEGLTWTQDREGEDADGRKTPGKLRLFSIGHSTHVTEWDLVTGRPLRHTPAGQAEVWCMASQPRGDGAGNKKNKSTETAATELPQEQLLALGCGDGSIVLLSTDDGELTYLKTLQRSSGKKPRVMSLAWSGRDKIVAGYSDSMIRVFEITGRGRLLKQMSLGTAGKGGPSETLVWTVKVLRDDTIVSGDSSGEIKIWDAKNFTLLQRLKSHLADVLSLAVNHDSTLLLSGGMDRRTVLYQRAASKGSRWAAVSNQRVHENDVKAMATYESMQMSVVISGGLDATPVVNPLRTFGQENHRALPAFPNSPTISSAPKARLLLSWWDREVNIWHVAPRQKIEDDEEEQGEALSTQHTLVARIAVQGEESITSARISPSGDLVAIASMSALKFFHIRPRKSASTYRITKLELPKSVSSAGAKMISFSPDGKWLVATSPQNHLRLHRLARNEDNEKQPWRLLDTVVEFRRHHGQSKERVTWGTHGEYGRVISTLAWSGDSRIVVAGDHSGSLETFVLEGSEDLDWIAAPTTNGRPKAPHSGDDSSEEESDDEDHPEVIFGQHWKAHTERLPRLPAPAVVLSFRPSTATENGADANLGLHATRHNPSPHSHQLPHGEDRLIAVTSKQDVLEFSAMRGKLTDWAKKNPPSAFPVGFRNVLDTASGALWDVENQKQRVWIHGSSWLWMFDLSRDFPDQETDSAVMAADTNTKKRKRDEVDVKKRVLIKNNAGAGGRKRENELASGTGMRVRTHKGETMVDENAKETTFGSVQPTKVASEDESDNDDGRPDWEDADSDDEDNQMLVALRRKTAADGLDFDRDEAGAVIPAEQPHHWHTFKYRPIIGIVPFDGAEEDEGDIRSGRALEVALVERPLWEADLKPRWEGPQEYGSRS